MKQFKLKAINLLLCVLTFTAASCKDDEKLSFNANEQESVGLTVSSKGIRRGNSTLYHVLCKIRIRQDRYLHTTAGSQLCGSRSNGNGNRYIRLDIQH